MNGRPLRGLAAAAMVLVFAAGAWAHVLDKKANKAAFNLRADVASQMAKYTTCLARAAISCEAKGLVSTPECDATTGTVAYDVPAGKATAKFQKALAACETKLNLVKKGTDYAGIGCPGDCSNDPGVQQCADLPAFEALVTAGTRGQINLLATTIDGACAGTGAAGSKERIKCVDTAAKQLMRYTNSLSSCARNCEVDEKGRNGGGAVTNDGVCLVGSASAAFTACEARAARALSSPAALALKPLVVVSIDAITDSLFNRSDPTDPAAPAGTLSPCGTCGNDAREGAEECDGASLGSCDACAADCTCTPAVCSNGTIEGSEECDGETLGACNLCASDCACAIDPILDGPEGSFCSSALSPSTTDYQALCVPTAGSGQHFRIEGAQTFGNNGFFYLTLGFPEVPAGNPTIAAGDGRFIFTGGKSQSCAYAWSYFRYSGITDPSAAALCTVPSIFADYPLGPQTVCLDVSSSNPPRVTFWATGANGANCKDASTLTASTALYSKEDWASADNQPVNATKHFVKLSSTSLATVSAAAVSSNTVLP